MDAAKTREAIRGLQTLLRQHRVAYAPVIDGISFQLAKHPEADIPPELQDQIRDLFGGMGSLTDIIICRANGHLVEDEASANRELERLQDALWEAIGGENTM